MICATRLDVVNEMSGLNFLAGRNSVHISLIFCVMLWKEGPTRVRKYTFFVVLLLLLTSCGPEPDKVISHVIATHVPETITPAQEETVAAPEYPPLTDFIAKLKAEDRSDLWENASHYGVDGLNVCPEFAQYTGYGMLMEPPEVVWRYIRSYFDGLCYEAFFEGEIVNGYSICILMSDAARDFRQEVSIQPDVHEVVGGTSRLKDVNFDGYLDILVNIGGGSGGQYFCAALIWDESTQQYVEVPAYAQIPAPRPDKAHNLIWGGCDANYLYSIHVYKYQSGTFLETNSISATYISDAHWDQGQRCTESAIIDGAWTEIGRIDFPESKIPPDAMKCYIEQGAVWSGWACCNPLMYTRPG